MLKALEQIEYFLIIKIYLCFGILESAARALEAHS